MSTFIFYSARAFKTMCLKHGSNKIMCSKRSCDNGWERCLYKAYCIECGFLMADFDETSRSCENDKVEILAYERIKVIFFMTETFHIYNGTRGSLFKTMSFGEKYMYFPPKCDNVSGNVIRKKHRFCANYLPDLKVLRYTRAWFRNFKSRMAMW